MTQAGDRMGPRLRFGFVLAPRFTLTAFAGFVDALRLWLNDKMNSATAMAQVASPTTKGAEPFGASSAAATAPTRPRVWIAARWVSSNERT